MKNNASALKPGTIYHIYNHANGFENLFVKEENYVYFLKKNAAHIPSVADTLAYCLMPNHIHLMVKIKQESQLPESEKLSGSHVASTHFNPLKNNDLSQHDTNRAIPGAFRQYLPTRAQIL